MTKTSINSNNLKPVPARMRQTNVFTSVVWLIPLIALIAGLWLLMQHIRNTGPKITLLMDSADGIEVNNTVIKVLSVDVGRVTKIQLNPDQKGVIVTAQLNSDVSDLMRKDTQFWVVKPRIDQSGITGLNTLVSGAYIAFTPGKSDEGENTFKVSDMPPISAIGQTGLRLELIGKNNKMISVGSPVMYKNFTVGQVESAHFDPKDQTVDYTIFIQSPNDKLVGEYSQFWLDSGITVQTTGSGVHIDSAPLPALISGAIEFGSPKDGNIGKPAVNEDTFELYNSRSQIDNLPTDRSLYYIAFFKQSVRGLEAGSPVEYKGINIGAVENVPYFARNDSLKMFQNGWIPVRIRLDPSRMEINAEPQSKTRWQVQLQAALNRGLTATIANDNLITGSKMIDLVEASGSPRLKPYSDYDGDTVIASQGGGLDELQAQLSKLLNKFNQLPLDKTVGELNTTLAQLKTTIRSVDNLVNKPQTQAIPAQLNQTLQSLQTTLKGISPNSPIYDDVQTTLKNIDKTLKQAQPVINTLKEKPNALIFNNHIKDPTPKGSRQ